MIPPQFEYVKPSSVSEALSLLRQHGRHARPIAGGQSLIPLMKAREIRPRLVVDITGLSELRGITRTDGSMHIGALTTHMEIEESNELFETLPIMREATEQLGDPMIKNRGTLGGSLAFADPGADWPAVALALDAQVHVIVPGDKRYTPVPGDARTVPIDMFFTGERTTFLRPDWLLTHVSLPLPTGRTGMAYLKLRHFASGYALVGAAAVVTVEKAGVCTGCRLAFTGAGPHAVRAFRTEEMLVGQRLTPEVIAAAAEHAGEGMRFLSDLYADERYRARLVEVYAQRALMAALENVR